MSPAICVIYCAACSVVYHLCSLIVLEFRSVIFVLLTPALTCSVTPDLSECTPTTCGSVRLEYRVVLPGQQHAQHHHWSDWLIWPQGRDMCNGLLCWHIRLRMLKEYEAACDVLEYTWDESWCHVMDGQIKKWVRNESVKLHWDGTNTGCEFDLHNLILNDTNTRRGEITVGAFFCTVVMICVMLDPPCVIIFLKSSVWRCTSSSSLCVSLKGWLIHPLKSVHQTVLILMLLLLHS